MGSLGRRALQAAVAIAVAAGVYLGHSRYFGAGLGELCTTASECSWSGCGHRICLQQYWGYCTKPCASDGDCPKEMRCEPKHQQGSLCLLRPKPPPRKPPPIPVLK